jgi:asparagine synthase (glutamine-hydrolysing)
MCGINGFILNYDPNNKDLITLMNNKIIHRGPDDFGHYNDIVDGKNIALGMRRLSIIDIDNGKQPIISDDGNLILVFNGEIYNYLTLKNELELNYQVEFITSSDTEVILKMYEIYGHESFSKLDGMFAFSILDKNRNKIFIARDYFGEKPLYYTKRDNKIIWSSELKSIVNVFEDKKKIDKNALSLYFQLTYIPAPYTIYKEVKKLLPNHYLEIDIKTLDVSENIISKPKPKIISKINFNDAKKITHDLVMKSVESRSISDVPIGTFLSGGVDSSIVSYCLSQNVENRINTFSIGFDKKKFDETEKSRVVAKLINSKHHEFIIGEKSLYSDLDKILNNFDEPFADSSALPTYLVSKKTSNHVKVALTGDGGDEVFGGYNKYYINNINNIYTNVVPEKAHKLLQNTSSFFLRSKDDDRGIKFKIRKTLDSIDYNNNFYWNMISLGFKESEVNKILINSSEGTFDYYKNNIGLIKSDSLSDLRNIDKHISLEGDMLVKVDRTSMLSSLECRAPFLNKKLWDFTNTLPEKYLINRTSKKYILKESFKDVFPSNFLEKTKKGFGVPVGDWLRSFLKDELIYFCNKSFIEEQNLFNYFSIEQLVNRHLSGQEDNTFKVWTYFCFQKWYKNHMPTNE